MDTFGCIFEMWKKKNEIRETRGKLDLLERVNGLGDNLNGHFGNVGIWKGCQKVRLPLYSAQ